MKLLSLARTLEHPRWCTHDRVTESDVTHLRQLDRFEPASDDVVISVAAARRDDLWPGLQVSQSGPGVELVELELLSTASTTCDAAHRAVPIRLAVSLDVASARHLAGVLLAAADVLERPDGRPVCVDCEVGFDPDSSPHLDRCWRCAERADAGAVAR